MSSLTLPEELSKLVVPNAKHSTWAKTFSCQPQYYFQPETIEQIKSLVDHARLKRKTLMTVGSGHSPSDLTMSTEWIVNLDKFNHILSMTDGTTSNGDKYTDVTVEAGVRIYQLNEFLATKGLAIQNLGSISDQSIAGIISTGTHGSSAYHGLVSQQIVDITIVNGLGQLIKCSQFENQDLFRASMLSLGKIGLISYVTIRTIPRYQIKSTQEVISFDTLLDQFEKIWISNEFIRIWWFPYSERCILWRASKTFDPISLPRESWYGTKFGRFFYESLLWLSVHIFPRLTPFVEKFVFGRQYGMTETYGSKNKSFVAVQESVEGLNMDCLFSQYVDEWTAPLTNGPEILRSLNNSIKEAAKSGEFFVHAPIEVRCSNTTSNEDIIHNIVNSTPNETGKTFEDNDKKLSKGAIYGNTLRPFLDNTPKLNWVPLDNVTNSQLTLYINATMYRPFHTKSPIGKWFKIFEETLEAAGGKPHWAKNFIGGDNYNNNDINTNSSTSTSSTNKNDTNKEYDSSKDGEMIGLASKMQEWFGDDLIKYRNVRREMDPEGVFLSGIEWVKRNGLIDERDVKEFELRHAEEDDDEDDDEDEDDEDDE
ncbi:hypothetical protein B5S31_g2495 [[Candida] boidinii]|nr:hypothetical protein B5S29_g1885 [[Candida] boidinii]OWB72773.1 hypothetical protein B5S31_g2495 [[Candida] boidinii]